MNINDFKQHLQQIHGTLEDDPANKQMKDRLQENKPAATAHFKKMHNQMAIDKQTQKQATTTAAETLKPKEQTKKEPIKDSVEHNDENFIQDIVLQYFEDYFGDQLNEDTSDEDIMEAVSDLVELCDAVCDAIGLDEDEKDSKSTRFPSGGNKVKIGKPIPMKLSTTSLTGKARHWSPKPRQLKDKKKVDEAIIKPKDFVMPSTSGSATIERGSATKKRIKTTFVPKNYAKSKRKIRTLKPSVEQLKTAIKKQNAREYDQTTKDLNKLSDSRTPHTVIGRLGDATSKRYYD